MWTTCPVCGKGIAVMWPDLYVYRRGKDFMCSENCLIVYETQRTRAANGFTEKRKEESKMALTQKQRAEVVELAAEGGNPIEYLKKAGVPNPWATWSYLNQKLEKDDPEKHAAVARAQDRRKAGAPENCKGPRETTVDTVDRVPPVEPVQCIAHVTAMDIEEVHEAADANRASFEPMPLILRGGVDYQLKVAEAKVAEAIEADRVQTVEITAQQIQPMGLQGGVDYQPKVDEAAKQEAKPPMNAIQRLAAAMNNMPREIELRVIKIESGLGTYTRGDVCRNVIYFRREIAEGDVIEVAMTEDDWRQLARELPKVMRTLGVEV